MAKITKPYTFYAHAVSNASNINSVFDTLYNSYNGDISDANFSTAGAYITASKITFVSANAIGSGTANSGSFTTLEATTAFTIPTSAPTSPEDGMIWMA